MNDRPVAPLEVVEPLLVWGAVELRDLPWRRTRDPWAVLVSEVMLQQTQVSRVIERYHEFLGRFPTVSNCAVAPASAVIELWAGLGYNRRAVNLWRAAVLVHDRFDGALPQDLPTLYSLPGVGPYTARAVLVFAFEHDLGVLDTNVGRLLARWTGARLAVGHAQSIADALVPRGQGWMWNQVLFDFASLVCTKRTPACGTCPLRSTCAWHGDGEDPAALSAAVSRPQSRFIGSERQVRGRIVDALRLGPVDRQDLAHIMCHDRDAVDLARIVAGLIADGLAVHDGELLMLPGTL